MTITILNKQSTSPANISAHYMIVNLDGKKVKLPQLCASRADYNKADKADMLLSVNIFQYHVKIISDMDVTDSNTQLGLLRNYNSIQEKYHPVLSDIDFWRGDCVWNNHEHEITLNLQEEMSTDFLSDIIKNRDYGVFREFSLQVEDLLSRDTKKQNAHQ